ncbi:hypothetical protein K7432_000974 [Basidiobolus ranarum]|uniref:Secreted protein n=1 Tax=Basidiobolus ranarum TaxID=34480 RepID=A0ABR2X470_9FUNG
MSLLRILFNFWWLGFAVYHCSRHGRLYEEDEQEEEYERGLNGRRGQQNYPRSRYGRQYEEDEQEDEYERDLNSRRGQKNHIRSRQ